MSADLQRGCSCSGRCCCGATARPELNSSPSCDGEGNHAQHGGGVETPTPVTPPPLNLRSMVPLPTSFARREETSPPTPSVAKSRPSPAPAADEGGRS